MIDELLEEFCKIRRPDKAAKVEEYLLKLERVTVDNPVQKINSDGKPLSFNDAGGKLLAGFIRRHPSVEEIYLPNHQMINSLKPMELDGWNSFLEALNEIKHAGCLRILDISGAQYTSEMLESLAEKVLYQHPSLTLVRLNSSNLGDNYLQAISPFLEMPSLQSLLLRSNRFVGQSFAEVIPRLRARCPKLLFIDLSGNTINLSLTTPLREWLESNLDMYIVFSLVGYEDLMKLSIRNRYEHFMPNRYAIMEASFVNLFDRMTALELRMEKLPNAATASETTEIRNKVAALETQLSALSKAWEQNKRELIVQLSAIAEKRVESLHQEMDAKIKTVSAEAADATSAAAAATAEARSINSGLNREDVEMLMNARLTSVLTQLNAMKGDVQAFGDDVSFLKGQVAADENENRKFREVVLNMGEKMDVFEDSIEEIFEAVKTFETMFRRMNALPPSLWQDNDITADYSPAQVAYASTFSRIIVQIHTAASMIASGYVQLHDSSKLMTLGTVISAVSGAAPTGSGIALSVLGYFLQAASEAIVKQRLQRLLSLGSMQEDVSKLAYQISTILLNVMAAAGGSLLHNNIVSGHHLQLLCGSEASSSSSSGFYGALITVIDKIQATAAGSLIVDERGNIEITVENMQKRAESDTNLFIAAVFQKGVPLLDNKPDVMQLVFLCLPLLPLVQRTFCGVMERFALQEGKDANEFEVHSSKKAMFVDAMLSAWETDVLYLLSHVFVSLTAIDAFVSVSCDAYYHKYGSCLKIKRSGLQQGIAYVQGRIHVSWSRDCLTTDILLSSFLEVKERLSAYSITETNNK